MKQKAYHLTDDLTAFARQLSSTLEDLAHIDMERVVIGLAPVRSNQRYGTWGACYPLRFEDGERTTIHGGQCWEWPLVNINGREILYYIAFYVPRFLDLPLKEKVETVVHELFHVSPHFNGDLRRLGRGRSAYHGPSLDFYRRLIRPLVEDALALVQARDGAFPFLTMKHAELVEQFGGVVGVKVKRLKPRLVS